MLIRFWGTRGSIPTPGRQTAFFGGNTSCVEIRTDDGRVILLDCGTGARLLGLDLVARAPALPPIDILVTHTHWDHIQGFPFFLPAYVPGARLAVYGARGLDRTLEASLSGQMHHTYFPVGMGELRAEIEFNEVSEQRFSVGRLRVTTQFLNHTAPTIGYRIEAGGFRLAYVTDHEPFSWSAARPGHPAPLDHPGDERHLEFIAGADLVIHDSQYADLEYPAKRGWGHSTIEYATDVAVRAGVRRLALFHHDPLHSDGWVRKQTERARQRARRQGAKLDVFAAFEGMEITVPEMETRAGARPRSGSGAFETPTGRILIAGSDRDATTEVRAAIATDGYRLTTRSSSALPRLAASTRPDLLILVGSESEPTLLEQVKRARAGPWGAKLPTIVLPGAEGPGAGGRVIDGATEVLSRPFNPAMLRPRVRAWLSRAGTFTRRAASLRTHRLIGALDLSRGGLLQQLPFNQRAALLTGALTCRFKPGEIIFKHGDPSGGVYFIRSGRVRISFPLNGKEQVLGMAKAGDTVGELAALDGGPRTATATAVEPTTTDYVAQAPFEAGLAEAPEAAMRLLRLLARRLRNTNYVMEELASRRGGATAGGSRVNGTGQAFRPPRPAASRSAGRGRD